MQSHQFDTTWVSRSGKVIVTDPCYVKKYAVEESSFKIAGLLENVAIGRWNASVDRGNFSGWGQRNWILRTWLSDTKCPEDGWIDQQFIVGVDSGQAGFFDLNAYPNDDPGEYGDLDSFYGKCCQATCDAQYHADVIDYNGNMGVVSSSGIGDGMYRCSTHTNENGEIDGIMLTFLWEDDSNDSDENSE